MREKLSQDSALFILSAARQALDAAGDTGAPGAHGKVEIPLITRGFDSYQSDHLNALASDSITPVVGT